MARKETNYEVGRREDRGYRVGTSASHYGGGQRTPYQQGRYDDPSNRNYNDNRSYQSQTKQERYPIGVNSGTQERYSEKGQSRIRPYEDAFSLTFCSRCRNPRPKNGLCSKCGGI